MTASNAINWADDSTQSFHQDRIKELDSDSYPDGTYDLDTMVRVDYTSGYQVTFCQIGDDYTASEYAEKVNEFLAISTDGIASAGKYGGTPEVSFNFADKETAIAYAKKYNQESIWDWVNFEPIMTGGTGIRKK